MVSVNSVIWSLSDPNRAPALSHSDWIKADGVHGGPGTLCTNHQQISSQIQAAQPQEGVIGGLPAVGGPSATRVIWSTLIQIVKTHPGFRITLPPHAHLRGGHRPARCHPGQRCCRCWWPSVPELRPTEVETAWSTASSTKILL